MRTVEVSYPLLGQSVRFEMELLRRDGRWYSYDAVTGAEADLATGAASAARHPAVPATRQ